jgi:hypothetical protein
VRAACRLQKQAVVWLARLLGKPILQLTEDHYLEHGLAELLNAVGRRRACTAASEAAPWLLDGTMGGPTAGLR